jgi:hypothetical protein
MNCISLISALLFDMCLAVLCLYKVPSMSFALIVSLVTAQCSEIASGATPRYIREPRHRFSASAMSVIMVPLLETSASSLSTIIPEQLYITTPTSNHASLRSFALATARHLS